MEEFLFKKVAIWIVLLLAIFSIIGTVFFGATVRSYHMGKHGRLASLANEVASIPSYTKNILKGQFGNADLATREQRFERMSGFMFNYKPGDRPDLGYLLLNRYNFELGMSVSELVDLNTQETVHQWHFNVDPLWEQSASKNQLASFKTNKSTDRFHNKHSFLLANGTIVDHNNSPFFSADSCSNLSLLNDASIFHHSIEMDHQGNFWLPKQFHPKTVEIGTDHFLDDGIAQLAPDGRVLFEKSVIAMLDENGFGHLIYGNGLVNDDPVHLNDIQPVLEDSPYWKIGDIFLSLRNQSMILLYRPSTNKIIWHHQGPWIHQHDVNMLDDHRISIFDNNSRLASITTDEGVVDGSNNEYIFDFKSGSITSPFRNGFKSLEIRTPTEGRGEIINPNEIFVEETNYGRLIQFNDAGEITWQYINRGSNGKVYSVSWSRLISRALGDQARNAIKESKCPHH